MMWADKSVSVSMERVETGSRKKRIEKIIHTIKMMKTKIPRDGI
jgi:hypothetical protein